MTERVSYNKTKIVATVGPASSSKEMLRALVKEGVDVFRLNFSHGTHSDHLKVIENVREINKDLESSITLLLDLQGPKIRVNEMQPGVEIVQDSLGNPRAVVVVGGICSVGVDRQSARIAELPGYPDR